MTPLENQEQNQKQKQLQGQLQPPLQEQLQLRMGAEVEGVASHLSRAKAARRRWGTRQLSKAATLKLIKTVRGSA
jgi:hypothetical protein